MNIEQLEEEAKNSAVKHVANMLQRPDQLEKVCIGRNGLEHVGIEFLLLQLFPSEGGAVQEKNYTEKSIGGSYVENCGSKSTGRGTKRITATAICTKRLELHQNTVSIDKKFNC